MQDDDSGTAAVMVSPELKELRATCDRLDIKWHHRHKESTLRTRINGAVENELEPEDRNPDGNYTAPDPEAIKHPKKPKPKPRPKRFIPQDVEEALDYCGSYHRGNTRRIREFIESIL